MKNHIINNLLEINDLITGLNDEQYCRRHELLNDSSIGQHVRHILEFYQCVFNGIETGTINYDSRKRDRQLETGRKNAIAIISEITTRLEEIKSDFNVSFIADYSSEMNKESIAITSSFYRELAYNLEHSIHHQALIKVAITEMQLTRLLADTFGYAPSTIRNNKLCAQ